MHPKGAIDNKTFDVYKMTVGDSVDAYFDKLQDQRLDQLELQKAMAGPSIPAKPCTPTQRLIDLEDQVKYVSEY